MGFSVGQVAGFAGVTVRTLHHYDEIGLLSPSTRTSAGYRRYGEVDLERLQQILFYRELGFALEEIATILDDPDADPAVHLSRQHELLMDRIGRLRAMVTAIEYTMEAKKMGIQLTPEERFEVFGDFDPEAHQEEAEERWGDTDAYRESRRRTANYSKQDWERIKTEAKDIERRLARAKEDDQPVDGPVAMDLAEEHRAHISAWYYDCTYTIHQGLGDMYVADERFTAHYEAVTPGLAAYLRDAIVANARRANA